MKQSFLIAAVSLAVCAPAAAPAASAAAVPSSAAASAVSSLPAPAAALPEHRGPIADDYPYRNGSWHQADPWGFYKRECTSFVAWRLNHRHGVKFTNHYKGAHWGNAATWDNAARATRVRVDHTPKVGAVGQWNRGRFGHVAYVAGVKGGTVTLEEYNRGGTHRYRTRTIKASEVENYIHIAR